MTGSLSAWLLTVSKTYQFDLHLLDPEKDQAYSGRQDHMQFANVRDYQRRMFSEEKLILTHG